MSLAIWIALGIAVLAASAPITQGGMRKINEKELAKYVRKTGLPLPSHLRTPLLQRISGRERWTLIGGTIGLALATVVSLIMGWLDGEGGVLVMLGVGFGSSLGGVLAILFGRHHLNAAAPRMARPKATELDDYLSRPERIGARLAPIGAIVAPIAGTLLLQLMPVDRSAQTTYWMGMAWTAAGVAVLSWFATEFAARKVLDSPQHAESRLELAWDDVGRGESLRGLYTNPIALTMLSALASLGMVGMVAIDPTQRAAAMTLTAIVGMSMLVISGIIVLAVALPGFTAWISAKRPRALTQLWAGEDFSTDARERAC